MSTQVTTRPRAGEATGPPGRRTDAAVVTWLVLALVLAGVVLANQWGVLTPDTKPELYLDPWGTLARELSTWRPDPNLGAPNYHTGFAPVVAVVAAIRSLGAPAWLAARLLRLALLLVGAAGVVRLWRRLTDDAAGLVAPATAATLYVMSPYAVVGAATLPVLLPYAFLPWLLVTWDRGLRSGGWRPAAGTALAFFAMGGMNAGVVPVMFLLALPAHALFRWTTGGTTLRGVVAAGTRAGLLCLAVSAYWLVPTALASGGGVAVAATTEAPALVGATSSWAEVLRGLGMWTMYGQANGEALSPAWTGYLTSPLVVLASFAVPALALAGAAVCRRAVRWLGVLLLAVALPVMVGVFPPAAPSPMGRAMGWLFENVPVTLAFRTTNKVGALAVLGVGLLAGAGAEAVARRLHARPLPAGLALAAAVAVLVAATLPAWTGRLYDVTLDPPRYWYEAADELDAHADGGRVWFLPGQGLVQYRWGEETVDDLDASLFDRPVVWRSTVPTGSAEAANLLTGVDDAVQVGTLAPGGISTLAHYLGVSDVLLRHDTRWEVTGGARPADLALQVATDPGLVPAGSYGRPGSTTVAPDTPGVARRPEEQDLAPLQHLAVAEPGRVARATTATGSLVVDGAGGALPLLADAGLLEDHPAVRLLGSMSGRDLATAVADGSRIVLTDTNRRRVHDPVRVGAAFSPTLGPDDTVADGAARALWDTDHQTVALLDGAADVSATAAGSPFGPVPWGAPEHAFDGDWRTAWTFGAFGSALGQSVTVEFEEPRALSRVDLRPLVDVGTRIAEVEVRAGDVAVSAELPAGAAVASVLLPPVTADDLTIEVTRTEGVGDNAVGLREIEIAGVAVDPYQRLPLGLTRLLQLRDEPAETLLADTPVDVLLQRQAHAPATDRDDEERRLDRAFTLPVARTHDVAGTLRLGPDVPDDVVDALFADLDVRATSSSRDFDQLAVRASAALDGDVRTAWQPGLGTVGEWLDVTFPRQRLEELTITQGRLDGQATTPVTEVRVTVDDRPPVTARLDGRRTTVDLPDRRASRVRVEVTGTGERVGPVRIAELDLGPDVVVPAVEDDAVPGRCLEAATIDGDPVQVRLDATFAELASGRAVPVRTCGRVHLDAGQHRLTAAPGVLLERLHLRDRLPGPSPTRAVPVDVQRPSPTHLAVDVPATDVPVLVSSGQAMDAGWRARLDGEDLGAPLLLDGYAAGWRVPAGPARRVVVDYAPQRTAEVTRVLSAVALAACVLLVLARRRGRR